MDFCQACMQKDDIKYRAFIVDIYKMCLGKGYSIEELEPHIDEIKRATGYIEPKYGKYDMCTYRISNVNMKNNKRRLFRGLFKLFPKENHWNVASSGTVMFYGYAEVLGYDGSRYSNVIYFRPGLVADGSVRTRSHFGQPTCLCDDHVCIKCNVNMKSSRDPYCKCCMKDKLVKSCSCFTPKDLCREVCPLMLKWWYLSQVGLVKDVVEYVMRILSRFVYFR